MSYKLVLLVRSDLKMSKGKTVAQCGHAVVDATISAINTPNNHKFIEWRKSGETIICLKVPDELTLTTILTIATRKEIKNGIIKDEGLTEVDPNTITVAYMGPDNIEKIDKLTGQLKCLARAA